MIREDFQQGMESASYLKMNKVTENYWRYCPFNPFASEAVYTRNFFFDRMSDSV